ncbi:LysE family translocator [Haloferacaceae archaeon DSL9]
MEPPLFEPSTLAAFVGASVALILSPGPDTAYVLTQGVGGGRRAGIAAAAGTSTGVLVHTTAAVLGLSLLLRTSAVAFAAVTYVGAVYLLYLGIRTIRGDEAFAVDEGGDDGLDPREAYRNGAAVNVFNPQVALFFLAFLPQFASPAGNTSAQLLVLGGLYAAITLAYLGGVATAADAARRLLAESARASAGLKWLTGSVLIGFGLRLLVGE